MIGECRYEDEAFDVQLVRRERPIESRAAELELTLSDERLAWNSIGRNSEVSSVRTVIFGGGALRSLRTADRLSTLRVASRARPF